MFDLAVTPTPVAHQTGQMVTVASGPRYCPVDKRGRQQYLEQVQPKLALVAKLPEREIVNRVKVHYKPLRKEDYSPKQAAEVARKFTPELSQFEKQLEMSKSRAFTGTANSLKFRRLHENSVVVWDDMTIDRIHPTRTALGEGPFRVIIGNELSITCWKGHNSSLRGTPEGIDTPYIMLQDMINERSVLSAHSGYFLLKD